MAETTYKRAIEIDRRTIGEDNPDFAARLNGLALVYYAQRRHDLAEETSKQARDIDRRTIGADHPSFAIYLNNLAGVYMKTDRYP